MRPLNIHKCTIFAIIKQTNNLRNEAHKMTLHISLLHEGALALLSSERVDIIITPITATLDPYLPSGKTKPINKYYFSLE